MDLHQGTWWETKAGGRVRIADMAPQHAFNCVRWLERYAETIALVDSRSMDGTIPWTDGEQASMDFAAEVDRDHRMKEDAVRWIRKTEVWQALNERAKGREPTIHELFGGEGS